MQSSSEQWLPVVGWEGYYEVSDHGRVRSVDRKSVFRDGRTMFLKGRVLRTVATPYGHLSVGLKRNGTRKTAKVHRLVLEAFVGPAPEGMECCHNNGDAADNRLGNLRWDSSSANKWDIIKHGRSAHKNKTHCKFGHPLDAPNLIASQAKMGRRACLACSRTRSYVQRRGKLSAQQYQAVSDNYYSDIIK